MKNNAFTNFCAALLLILPVSLCAQRKEGSPEAKAFWAGQKASYAVFFDRKRSTEDRLAAVKPLGYADKATMAALLEVGADRTEGDAIRSEAFRIHAFNVIYIDLALKILGDPKDGGEELHSYLISSISRRTTFRLPVEYQQRIQATWRKALDDSRGKVRLSAYRALVSSDDMIAINRLSESLRKGKDFPIPLPEMIYLMHLTGAVNHIVVLRPYLNHADPQVQAIAAQALAVDPESRPKIVEIVKKSEMPYELCRLALRALARKDEKFADYAIPLMEDTKVNPKLREEAMNALFRRMNKTESAIQIRYAEAVEKISADQKLTTEDARTLRERAAVLHRPLKGTFPEIQKRYEKR